MGIPSTYWAEMKEIKDEIDSLMDDYNSGRLIGCKMKWSARLKLLRNRMNELILKGDPDAKTES